MGADPWSPPPPGVEPLPDRDFVVGVTTTRVNGGGHLHVSPGQLVCRLGPINRAISGFDEVRHKSERVPVYVARLIPPWFSVAAVLDDGTRAIRVSVPRTALNRLVRALSEAGFEVDLRRTWFDRGSPA